MTLFLTCWWGFKRILRSGVRRWEGEEDFDVLVEFDGDDDVDDVEHDVDDDADDADDDANDDANDDEAAADASKDEMTFDRVDE